MDLPTGNFLKDLIYEINPWQYFREFVSLGPKTYAYNTNGLKTVVEIEGFTINGKTKGVSNFYSLIHMLENDAVVAVNCSNAIQRVKRKFAIVDPDQSKHF